MSSENTGPLFVSLLVALVAGCDAGDEPSPDASPVAREPFVCTLGQAAGATGFVPLGEDSAVELLLGFQGFLVVELVAQGDEDTPPTARAKATVTVEGGEPFGSVVGELDFHASGDSYLSRRFPLVLNTAEVGYFKDRAGTVSMRFEGAERECVTTAHFRFVDYDACVHTGEERSCPEDAP